MCICEPRCRHHRRGIIAESAKLPQGLKQKNGIAQEHGSRAPSRYRGYRFCRRCRRVVGFRPGASDRARLADTKINRCSVYGSDFVQIEGTDACARVGGHIRVEIGAGNGLRGGFNRSDSDGARPAGLTSGQNAGDPPFGDMQGSPHGHLRVAPLPGAHDLFAR
jgi:hypothetical protein